MSNLTAEQETYVAARDAAKAAGFTGNFMAACAEDLAVDEFYAGPLEWNQAADRVLWVAKGEQYNRTYGSWQEQCDGEFATYKEFHDAENFDYEAAWADQEPEGPGITEPMECAYGPQEPAGSWPMASMDCF